MILKMMVSEVFYSIQGEGARMGEAAAFVRFFGCDLDCDFCDEPLHKSKYIEMSPLQVFERIQAWPTRWVILTGGEPSLEDRNLFIAFLQKQGYQVAVETNGYDPEHIARADWITYSPKDWDQLQKDPFYDELKLICDAQSSKARILEIAEDAGGKPVFLQPLTRFEDPAATEAAVSFCRQMILDHPRLRLSLGLQRFLKFK
ncbi:MAG: 7-carboxy-7-deazaguanine synthase QueE [bacterium]|nr:7-carboxy-7-deazaguanine synthase QueE [bacterium]